MDQATITSEVRRWLQQVKAVTVSDTSIASMTLRGVNLLWLNLRQADPDFIRRRKSISSNTNVFPLPSDCMTVNHVWSMVDNASSVSDASNVGGEVNLQITDHPFEDDDTVLVHSVAGTTEANGTWNVSVQDDNNITLDDSEYANAYTSGGKVFKELTSFTRIRKRNSNQRRGTLSDEYFIQGANIVVDKIDFSYDIIVDYEARPTTVGDIPEEYHEGLVSFVFMQYLPLYKRPKGAFDADILKSTVSFHTTVWKQTLDSILINFRTTSEPTKVDNDDGWNWNELYDME